MRLIITGGLGHIGTGILEKTANFKMFKEIIVIDNHASIKINFLINLRFNIPVRIIDADINDLNLKKIFKKDDVIIHLAAITNATESFKIKKNIFLNNFSITKKIVDISNKLNLRCIFFSSTSVYGSNDKIMYEDDVTNLNPQSPYAECKIKEENYITKYSKKFVILRLGTIFGVSRGIRFHTAVNKFCLQSATNKPLTIWKTAMYQKRPYLDINDAIRCFSFIIKHNLFFNEILNVVSVNLSLHELILILKKYKKIKIKLVSSKIMNQLSYIASNKKIKNYGFKFNGNLHTQIKKTINLFKGNLL